MAKTFLFSDPHFGHNNIIRIANRPFSSVEVMNSELIKRWNSVVTDADTVYLLGDICQNMSKEAITNILKQLKGKIVLVMGNHDWDHGKDFWIKTGRFELVSPYSIVLNDWWLLSHAPMYLTASMPYCNIYGHVHSDDKYKDSTCNSFCVCAERINYTPIEFSVIKTKVMINNETYY